MYIDLRTAQGEGLGNWSAAYAKAKAAVKRLSNEEKNNITFGYNSYELATLSGCAGLSLPAPSIGFPGLCFADAGNGLRATDLVNAYPAGVHAAASWNRKLTYDRALYIGQEFKAKGGMVDQLSPTCITLSDYLLLGINSSQYSERDKWPGCWSFRQNSSRWPELGRF